MSSRGDWMKDLEERTVKAFLNRQTNYVRKCPALQMVQEQRSIIYTLLETENGTRWGPVS